MAKTKEAPDTAPEAPAKKPRRLLRAVLGVVVLGGAAAGGALYAQTAGLIQVPGLGGAPAEDPNKPHLVPREGVTPTNYDVVGERPVDASKFQISYYPIEENFTSNLKDGSGFIQIGIGVSTYYDERVLQNLERHEMAVRSAVLMQLADQDPEAVATPQGKRALKASLAKAVNNVLKEKEGFGGIDDVYFTGFVIQ
jgi:flagellar protein FliL